MQAITSIEHDFAIDEDLSILEAINLERETLFHAPMNFVGNGMMIESFIKKKY